VFSLLYTVGVHGEIYNVCLLNVTSYCDVVANNTNFSRYPVHEFEATRPCCYPGGTPSLSFKDSFF
jgi:hypothetical protein